MIKKKNLKKTISIVLVLFFVVSSVSVSIPASIQQETSSDNGLEEINKSTFNRDQQFVLSPLSKDMILWGWWWPDFPAHFESFFERTDIAEFHGAATALSAADFNDDGLLDVVLKWNNGPFGEDFEATITILYNNGDGTDFTPEDVYTIDYTRIQDLNAADYDNDGDVDVLFTYSGHINGVKRNGTGWMLLNNGENEFNAKKNVFCHEYDSERHRWNPHITSADFDDDNDIDFLVGDNSGLVAFYKNDGAGNFTHICTSDFDNRRISWGLDSGDFNGDNHLDFIVTERDEDDYGDGYIYIKYNDGSSTCFDHDNYTQIVDLAVWEYESFQTTMFPIADGCIRTIDYNADGLMDIVYGGPSNLFLFIQQEDGEFLPVTIARLPGIIKQNGAFVLNSLRSGGITVGDFNSDDKTDVMIGGSLAEIQCLHNTHTLIDIVYPDRSCIIRNDVMIRDYFPLYFPLKHATSFVTGDITIKTEELESLSKVEFYLDNKLVFTDEESPFEWEWNTFSFGRHTVKAQAFDLEGSPSGFDTTRVWKFL